jgi:hypothetical protein
MKKIFRYTFAILASGLMLTACNKDNDGPVYNGPDGVAFNANIYTVNQIPENLIEIPINRAFNDEQLTVSISGGASFTPAMAAIFTLPASVSFAPGESTTMVPITVNKSMMLPETPYSFTIRSSIPSVSVNGESARTNVWDPVTYNGYAETEVRASYALTWGDVRVGKYTAGAYSTTWGIDPAVVIYTKWQKANGDEFYRLVDAYQPETTYEGFTLGTSDIWAQEMLSWNNYIVINARNPANVTIAKQRLGVDWGYGNMAISGTGGTLTGNILTIENAFDIGDGRGDLGTDIIDFNPQQP